MKKVIILVACWLAIGSLQAQPKWNGSGGWGAKGQFGRMYDPKTVETIHGEVTAIEEMTPLKGMGHGIHLRVKTEKETVPVHLGPSWFLLNQDVQIRQGDQVEITGSRVKIDDKPAIIAAKVNKGADVLTLRDEVGIPVWAGWRKSK